MDASWGSAFLESGGEVSFFAFDFNSFYVDNCNFRSSQ